MCRDMSRVRLSEKGVTLMETLIVVSLIAMTSMAIYSALANGLKVWKRTQQLVVEEDIVIFFDKLSQDLRNTYFYAKFNFDGGKQKITFPAIIQMLPDKQIRGAGQDYVSQLGKVEYYYDGLEDIIYRRQANYSQSLSGRFSKKRALVRNIQAVNFKYFYYAEGREIYSPEAFETYPARIEVEVEFSDKQGNKRMNRSIDLFLES